MYLDYYEMYKSSGADKVEEQAINFVKRLVQTRLKYYFKTSNIEEIEKDLITLAAPDVGEIRKSTEELTKDNVNQWIAITK